MRYLTNIFFKGLAAVVPVALTFYLFYWLDRTLEQFLRPVMPEGLYWPGQGLIASLLLIFFVGLFVDAWLVRWVFHQGEAFLAKIPLVKSVYAGLRDFMTFFARMQQQNDLKKVVSVRLGETRLIGFLTSEERLNNLPGETDLNELVAVYVPMSYQIGGFAVYVHRDLVEPLDIPVGDAMRLVLTAGLSRTPDKKEKPADVES